MKNYNSLKRISTTILFFSLGMLISCSSFKIENVTYGWSGEFFANPDENGNISIPKSSMAFNVSSILKEEKITTSASTLKIHTIRDDEGYYYIVSDKFLNVWVFESAEKSLKLYDKLDLTGKQPLQDPKFNEQKPYIKLFTKDGKEFIINKKGIVKKEEIKK